MDTSPRWIGYDTFKLIVAIVLLLLLLVLILQQPLAAAPAPANPAVAATGTQALAVVQAPPTAAPALPPTPAPIPTATSAPPTAAPTSAPTAAPTAAPTSTSTSAAAPTAAPAASPAAACKPPAPSRLSAGKNASTLRDLNLRSEPKIDNNILTVDPAGTTLKVLQGPVCVPYQGSAYLWWQVETPGGKTGWSAENYLNGLGYYMKPLP